MKKKKFFSFFFQKQNGCHFSQKIKYIYIYIESHHGNFWKIRWSDMEWLTLKGGGTEKRGNKDLKKRGGGQAGSRGGYLKKRGTGTPLWTVRVGGCRNANIL